MIAEDTRMQYAGLYLLKTMVDAEDDFSLALANDEKVLEPILKWLCKRRYADISGRNTYQVTEKGQEVLDAFIAKFQEFVENYDVFCAVDLKKGEFAFSFYDDYDDDQEWQDFLEQSRWDDLRVAVCEHQNIDPTEMVVMSFMNDGQFGESEEGWDYELLLGSVWDEIEEVIATSIKVSDLSYSDGKTITRGKDVIEDIISQGQKLLKSQRSH